MNKKAIFLLALILTGISVLYSESGTITFRNGFENTFSNGVSYTGTQDTSLRSSPAQATFNYGGGVNATFNSTAYAGLLYFDLSSFSGTVATVENATLRLGMRGGAANVVGTEVKILIYEMKASNAGWRQGSGNGTEATANEVAWAFKAKGQETEENVQWAGKANAFSNADYGSTLLAGYDFVIAAATAYIDIPLPSGVIANWINNPGKNAGLVIRSDNATTLQFYTSEHNTQQAHPGLTFDYTLGQPEPEAIALPVSQADNETANSLQNGSFERFATNNTPDSWSWMGTRTSGSGRSDERTRAGRYSLKIHDDSAEASIGLSSAPIPISGGAVYRLSGYVFRENSTSQPSIHVRYYDSSMTQIYAKGTSAGTGVGQWNQLSEDHRAPANAAYARVICNSSSTSTGTIFFDAVSFLRSDEHLVVNPDMAQDEIGHHPAGWLRWSCLSGRSGTVEADPQDPANHVLRLVDNSPTAASAYYTKVTVTANMTYEAGAEVLWETGSTPSLHIKYFDSNGTEIASSASSISPATIGIRQKLSITTHAPEGASHATIIAYISVTGTGVAHFGNVYFKPVNQIRYAASTALGTGNGDSAANAAKYNNRTFWSSINNTLASDSVKVIFLEGKYIINNNDDALYLQYIGNDQHMLTLEGQNPFGTVFTRNSSATTDLLQLVTLRNVKNMVLRHLHWEDDAPSASGVRTGYSLAIQATGANSPTRNITVEGCSFIGLWRNYYGALGVHHEQTSYVTVRHNEFVGGGLTAHFHMVYASYGPQHLNMLGNYFQDATGAYMRHRAGCAYVVIKNNHFVSTNRAYNQTFVEQAVFNDVNPGDETLGHTFLYSGNTFDYQTSGGSNIAFNIWASGFDPYADGVTWNYLMTQEQGRTLASGSLEQKKAILRNNFGLDFDDNIIFENNTRIGHHQRKASLLSEACCGASKRGGEGTYDISDMIGN